MVDQIGGRVVIFVDGFDREARGNCDGQQVLVLDIESLSFLCVVDVKAVGLAKGASKVFNRPFICSNPHLVSIRGCIGLGQSPKHFVHKAIEFFFVLSGDFMAERDSVGGIELGNTFDTCWICRSRLHLLEFEIALFEVYQ